MRSIFLFLCSISVLGLRASTVAAKGQPSYRQRKPGIVVPHQNGSAMAVNAASFEPGVSPGELATILGRDLTSVSGVVVATALPLPTELAGVTVVVDGMEARLYSIAFANGEDQISFQVPFETATGPSAAEIQVFDRGVQGAYKLRPNFHDYLSPLPSVILFMAGECAGWAVGTSAACCLLSWLRDGSHELWAGPERALRLVNRYYSALIRPTLSAAVILRASGCFEQPYRAFRLAASDGSDDTLQSLSKSRGLEPGWDAVMEERSILFFEQVNKPVPGLTFCTHVTTYVA